MPRDSSCMPWQSAGEQRRPLQCDPLFRSGTISCQMHGRATATFAFESASTSFASLALYHLRMAFMTGNHIGFVALDLV